MKLSEEQIRVIKSLSLFALISIVADIISLLIKGNFSFSDTLVFSLLIIIGCIGLGAFFVLGMKTPKK